MVDIETIIEGGRLQAHLERLFPSNAGHNIAVGITLQGRHCIAATGAAEENHSRAERLGCITKLLTAALLRQSIARGSLTAETSLKALLGDVPGDSRAEHITVKDLINHTHGLDDSHVPHVPLLENDCIDRGSLLASVFHSPPISAPGRRYSYGHVGAWLGAAVLEATCGKRYPELLASSLLSPLGVAPKAATLSPGSNLPRVCPAVGGALAFTSEDMLRFLDHQMTCSDFGFAGSTLGDLERETVSLPGWHSTEQGIYFGWKYYGGGWFGHNSQIPSAGMMVRIQPTRQLGIVIASGRYPPARIARPLFREYLPDLVTMQMPHMRAERAIPPNDARRFVGDYRNRSIGITVSQTDSLELQMRVTRFDGGDPAGTTAYTLLRPADDNIFFLVTVLPELTPYMQFLVTDGDAAEGLWNGLHVLPRADARDERHDARATDLSNAVPNLH